MAIDWTALDELKKPAQREVVQIIDEVDDASLDAMFSEHVAPCIDAGLRPDQKEAILAKAKQMFRTDSKPATEILELVVRARKYVARFAPTQQVEK